MGRPKGRPNGPGQLSEPAFVQTQNLVLITVTELKLSAFLDNDGIETVFMTCFFDGFQDVKISFLPIF